MPIYDPPTITARNFFDPVNRFPGLVQLGDVEPNWYRFAHGYKLAADELVAHVNEDGGGAAFICYPILFLYRHSVELYLKALLLDVGELLDANEATSGRHDLMPLWRRFTERLLWYDASQDSPWLDRITALIAELDNVDRQSFSFRYPVAKDGTQLLTPGHAVNIQHFAEVMRELYLILEGAAAMLSEHLDLKYESEQYNYYDYYSP